MRCVAVLCCAVLCCSVLYCAMLCCVILCQIVTYPVVSCQIVSCHIVSCNVMSCCVVLCCVVLCCVVLCCAMLWYTQNKTYAYLSAVYVINLGDLFDVFCSCITVGASTPVLIMQDVVIINTHYLYSCINKPRYVSLTQ